MADDQSLASSSPLAPKPAHVPDALVYDFDLFFDPGLLADPHARVLDMVRNAPPIFWTPHRGGAWMVTSHAGNFDISRDWESFSSQLITEAQMEQMAAFMPAGGPHIPQPIPINLDPPAHGVFRMPVNGPFSPKAMNKLKDYIRDLAAELIEGVKPQGGCEFMSTVAEIMPVQVFLKMMGLPLERQVEYRELVKAQLAGINGDAMAAIGHMRAIAEAMRDTFEERRTNPQDDLISLLWKTQINGKPTTMEDMENYGVLMFIAGLDTVMNGMGFGVRHLARDLPLQDRLRQNPELIGDAAEELLRRYTFTVPTRRVAKDLVFDGVEMMKDDRLFLFLPGADLDAKRFSDPDTFDLDREDKVHIAFNAGPHRCLGSHLARVELEILYEEMLARLPQFRLDPAKPATFHGGHVIGVDSLDLLWDA